MQHGAHGWLAEGEGSAQLLSDGIVRWLFGEGYLARSTDRTFELSERGEAALEEAVSEAGTTGDSAASVDAGTPVLLLGPAPHSEELDYLLVVPFGRGEAVRHAERLRRLAELQGEERFEFVQFRDEIFALPITPRLAEFGLLREGNARLLAGGLPDPAELGLRHCPDRGVNYGREWLQWFGGFDPESPLIVSSRLPTGAFDRLIRNGPGTGD